MYNIKKIIINLENRPNRLINTLKELKKVNLSNDTIRIEACNPNYAEMNMHKYINNDIFNNIKNPTSTFLISSFKNLACAISHIKSWEYVILNKIPHAIIIEDDIEIVSVFVKP